MYNHARSKIVARGRLDNARQIHQAGRVKYCWRQLRENVARRKAMKQDAITRQLLDEEPGNDEFFSVQVRVQGSKTAAGPIFSDLVDARMPLNDETFDLNAYTVNLTRGEQTQVAIPNHVIRQVTI